MNYHPRKPLSFSCSQEEFEAIHEALAKVRSTSKTVVVPKEALAALLRDHSNLVNLLEKATI